MTDGPAERAHRALSVVHSNLEQLPELSDDEEDEMMVLGVTALSSWMVSIFRRIAREKRVDRTRAERRTAIFQQQAQGFDEWDERNRPWPPPMVRIDAPEPPGWDTTKWQWPRPPKLYL
jgi:hypothetical protein